MQEQISLFEKSSVSTPLERMSIREFLKRIKNGYWKKYQEKVKAAKSKEEKTRIKRFQTPCVTISGAFDEKRSGIPDHLSGYICIDVDADDNPDIMKKRNDLEDDPYIFAVFTSISGNGLALIFKIKPKKHYEYFNGIQSYLYKEYKIVVDPGVKDPARLRFVSYDKNCYTDFKKDIFDRPEVYRPTPALANEDVNEDDVRELIKQIEKQKIDIAPRYNEWYIIGQALALLGEKGRKYFHSVSKFNEEYDKDYCDLQFDNCLNQESKGNRDSKVGLGSLFFYAKENGVTISAPGPKIKSSKKVGPVTDHKSKVLLSVDGHKIERGFYSYHIWMFKVLFKKDESPNIECIGLFPEGVSDFLFNKGIRRGGKIFYKLTGNIVEVITWDSIMDMIVQEGVKLPKNFEVRWDEEGESIVRKAILNKVQSGGRKSMERDIILKEFVPDEAEFIKDQEDFCHLFFKNGIVTISKKGYELTPWNEFVVTQQQYVWKEQIIDHEFKYVKKKSLIQTILENAIGKDYWNEVRSTLGYMIHTFTYGEGTEILFCIDRNVGELNEGGNGKDFFKQILEQTRKVVNVPGKSLNIGHQFSWERIDRDTQIVWIEDLGKHIRMEQLYNLNNGISVRRMHTQPFTVKSKIGISLQHLINMEGSSDQRRQIFLLFTDYYSTRGGIGKVHGDRDIFGEKWEGWDEYYSMIVDSAVYYLKHGIQRMNIEELIDLRKQELSDGSFESMEQGKWYSTEGAIALCWGEDTVMNTETFIAFRKKLAQWAKLSGLEIEAERKSIDKKQCKAIRIVAPMRIVSRKQK